MEPTVIVTLNESHQQQLESFFTTFHLSGEDVLPVATVWPKLVKLYQEMMIVNAHTNLTRLTSPEDFILRHVGDSCLLLPHLPQGVRLADVGSGAGFPAIPLALFRPDISVMAIESVGKKADFIQAVSETLGISDRVRPVPKRVEELTDWSFAQAAKAKGMTAFREAFDVVVVRALSSLPTLLELALPLVKESGVLLALKGPRAAEEVTVSRNALSVLGGEVVSVVDFEKHPQVFGTMLVSVRKIAPTDPIYPRPMAQIKKSPLGPALKKRQESH